MQVSFFQVFVTSYCSVLVAQRLDGQ